MGLIDVISKEERVDVTYSDFYNLMLESAKFELASNGIKNNVPHEYMRAMLNIVNPWKSNKESEE